MKCLYTAENNPHVPSVIQSHFVMSSSRYYKAKMKLNAFDSRWTVV